MYNIYDVGLENLVLIGLISIALTNVFFILFTYLLDIVLVL